MKKRDKIIEVVIFILYLLVIVGCLGFFVFYGYVLAKYSDTPIADMPGWAYWLVFKGR